MKPGEDLEFGPFRLDRTNRRLLRASEEIPLAPKAIDLLTFLAEHAGRVLLRDELLSSLWPGTFVDDHALSVQIRDIRRALGDDPKTPRYIETRHRRGYRFVAEVREAAAPGPSPAAAAGDSIPETRYARPETRYARSGDVNIAFQVLGEGPIDLVFVMGWVSHLEYFWTEPSFARFLRRLAGFSRLILFDKRGTGLSDRVPIAGLPTLEQRMDDVRAVMDAAGSRQAVICGVSEGGPMSALFAATYPDKVLALLMFGTYARRMRDADYPWGPSEEERNRFLEQIRTQWGGPVGIEERAPSLAQDPHFREWWAAYLRMGASPGAAEALTRMNAAIDVRSVLPTIRVPTLVLHRSGDQCLKVEEGRYVASRIPGAAFVELPGSDHLPFAGEQDEVLERIREFVAGVRHGLAPDRVLATVLLGAGNERALGDLFRNEVRWQRGVEAARFGLAATFDGPARAIRCAWAVAEYAARVGAEFRAALHTGECDRSGEAGVAGPGREVAEQVLRRTGAGEIQVTATVRDLVAGSGIRFAEQGLLVTAAPEGEWRLLRVVGAP